MKIDAYTESVSQRMLEVINAVADRVDPGPRELLQDVAYRLACGEQPWPFQETVDVIADPFKKDCEACEGHGTIEIVNNASQSFFGCTVCDGYGRVFQ